MCRVSHALLINNHCIFLLLFSWHMLFTSSLMFLFLSDTQQLKVSRVKWIYGGGAGQCLCWVGNESSVYVERDSCDNSDKLTHTHLHKKKYNGSLLRVEGEKKEMMLNAESINKQTKIKNLFTKKNYSKSKHNTRTQKIKEKPRQPATSDECQR